MDTSLVVLTDFFAVSNRALSYAAGLAVPLRAHLVLLHVRQDRLLDPEEYKHEHSRRSELKITHTLEHLAAEQPVPAEVAISDEFLPDAVKDTVRRHHPLMLVLGRPGADSIPQEVVTSTVLDLIRHAPYPLLVVPAAGWDAFPPRRFLLAIDGQPFFLYQHQNVLRQLLYATQGTLDVVHVTDDEHVRPDSLAVLRTITANDLVPPLPEDSLHEVYHPSIVGGILQQAAHQQADVLVVVARRHSLLGSLFHRSVTAQLLREISIPVLLLPAED
jgi:nucleotide-binding universal stress UspA family protein